MRLISLVAVTALSLSGAAFAQTGGTGTSGSLPGTGINGSASLSGGSTLGRPPSALGSTTSLNERIDRAAGLNSTRARGGISLPQTLRSSATSAGGALGALSAGTTIDNAGRPAGTPLGTSASSDGLAAGGDPQ